MLDKAVLAAALVLALAPLPVRSQEAPFIAETAGTEGPTQDREGNLYFSDLFNDRIMKLAPGGEVTVFRDRANGANGLVFDAQGRLIACERGPIEIFGVRVPGVPRITRTDLKTGKVEVLAEAFQGRPFVAPNDVTLDNQGRIYFTDRAGSSVYRIDPTGEVARLIGPTDGVQSPNGIQISPDDKALYIIDSSQGAKEARVVRRYDLRPDGSVANMRVHYDFKAGRGGDGASIDSAGNLYVSAGMNRPRGTEETTDNRTGVYVISPAGRLVKFIPVSEDFIRNNTFGGPDMKALFVAAGAAIIRIDNDIPGLPR